MTPGHSTFVRLASCAWARTFLSHASFCDARRTFPLDRGRRRRRPRRRARDDRAAGSGERSCLPPGRRDRRGPGRHDLWRQHGLRQAGACAHQARPGARSAAESDPQPRIRRRRTVARRRRAGDDAVARQRAAARHERGARDPSGADRRHAERAAASARPLAGERRGVGRSRPPRAPRARHDRGGGGRPDAASQAARTDHAGSEGGVGVRQRHAGPDRAGGVAGARRLGPVAHGARRRRDEPRGRARHARAVRPADSQGPSPRVSAAVRDAAACPARRFRDPRVASRKRPASPGRVLAPLHAAGPGGGGRRPRVRGTPGGDGAERGNRQSPGDRRRDPLGGQLPRSADRVGARRHRDRARHTRGAGRAPARADRESRPVVRVARVPGPGSRPRVGVHAPADRGAGAGGGVPRAGHAGERAVRTDGREPGGRRADGHDRGVESRADTRQRRPDRGDRAARGGAGARVLAPTQAGAGRGPHARCGASSRAAARRRPSPQRRYRTHHRGSARRNVRSRAGVTGPRTIRAPRGPNRTCKGWVQEAALRMLMNNLDPDVAERPQDLVVYGGTGKAARDWPAFDAICRTLVTLGDDETLLVQSGKPVGVFTTHPEAPRVLIANANLVGRWATWDVFRELERQGLIMYGQMTAGSWIYIGTQGILQGTYETFGAVARRHFAGSLAGRLVLTGGLGGMGGAHPLSVKNHEGGCLAVAAATALRRGAPEEYVKRSVASIATHVRAMLALQRAGAVTFDYGNNIRTEAREAGVSDAFAIPGFVPEYIRPLFCEGKGPFRWVALSGDPRDVERTDRLVLELFPEERHLRRWIELARERVAFQGLPARICWLGQGERARFGCALDDLVKSGDLAAPVVIGRDHLDAGSVASPFRETEAMRDGSDAIADWPILNALLNTASGAGWVSFHHGGGVGIGNSLHAGQVSVADGSAAAGRRLERVLTNDPGIGVARHADAGYPEARATAPPAPGRAPPREAPGS